MLHDLRLALRALLKAPGFAGIALLTLTLGISATAAAFSILYAVLLRPLPYPNADRLVVVFGRGVTTDRLTDWQQAATSYDAFAALGPGLPNVETPDGPERVRSLLVSRDFFDMLGLGASAGRVLGSDDFRPDSASVMVTDRLAARLFGSPAAALGRVLHLVGTGYANETYQIVGTIDSIGPLPYSDISVIMPLLPLPRAELFLAIARLKPGATIAAARSEAHGIAAGLAAANPSRRGLANVNVEPLKNHVLGDTALTVRLIFAAALLVFIISGANVAHLVLARSTSRARDIATRLALGASRVRIARGLLWESLLVSSAAAVAGLWLSTSAVRLLIALVPYRVPRLEDAHNGGFAVIAFTVAVAALTAVAFVLTPLLAVRGLDLHRALKEGSRQAAGSAGQRWFRSLLVSTEIAIASIVLVVAGLLIETFVALRPSEPGFNPHEKLILRIGNTRATESDSIPLVADLQSRIGSLPGVRAVAAATDLPMTGMSWVADVNVVGQSVPDGASPNAIHARAVTANYFSAMQTAIVSGRDFTNADMAQRLSVAVVNQEFVRRFLSGVSPLGQRVSIVGGGPENATFEIVGIARDARIFGDTARARPEMYVPFSVAPYRGFYIVIDTAGDPLLIAGPVRAIVRELAPAAVITNMQTMDQLLHESVAQPRFHALLLGTFAGLAVVLALAGIYAVMSYAVTRRRHEMGVRIALGAHTTNILALVLRDSLRLALSGLIIGLPAAFALSRTLTALLYDTGHANLHTYVASAAALVALALAAAFVPALRAARVDPVHALRAE